MLEKVAVQLFFKEINSIRPNNGVWNYVPVGHYTVIE